MTGFAEAETGLFVSDLTWSPILGPEGNMEFLCRLTREDRGFLPGLDPEALVHEAHAALDRKRSL